MNIKPIKTQKTLNPSEESIKELINELFKLYVNMPKKAYVQKKIVANIIDYLKNNKINFKQLFETLLFLMKNVKTKESKAVLAKIFNEFQKTYKYIIRNKN